MPTGQVESRPGSEDLGTDSLINSEGGKSCTVPCILNEAPVATGSTPTSSAPGFAVTAHRETSTVMFRRLLSLVKIEHTLFALPLAFTGSILAARGMPSLKVLGLVALAFAGARTAAMAFNRLADRHLDALNPRTADREIPSGQINVYQAWALVVIAVGTYFLAALALNWVCFSLSPVASGDSACLFLFQALHLVVPPLLGTMSWFGSSGRLAGRHGASRVDSRGPGNRGSLLGCRL